MECDYKIADIRKHINDEIIKKMVLLSKTKTMSDAVNIGKTKL